MFAIMHLSIMIYFIFMQLNQQEYIKEKPFCQSVSMEEQGDKYLICFVSW